MRETPPRRLIGLVDCSAFYCSCERVFDPRLEAVPVAVLSNNDGCVIARSQEIKDVGIKMGAPFFKCRSDLREIGAAVFSSNYTLYGDMSRRVMETLHSFTPDVAQYSIDEAFLSIPTPPGSPEAVRERVEALAREIRARVLQWTGIPVRVSFAETKTLAKAASEYAKVLLARGEDPCVCLFGHPNREDWLAEMYVGDVWGVGRRWATRLATLGGSTAATLAGLPDTLIRSHFNIVLLRTVHELRGHSCLPLDDAPLVRQTLVKSRSFGEPVSDLTSLSQAVSTHAARAAEKLRREGLIAGRISAFITTKGFGKGPHRSGGSDMVLQVQTADTGVLISAARACLRRAYIEADRLGRPYRYRKAGVMLTEIQPAGTEQGILFSEQPEAGTPERAALMQALDEANRRFGKRAVVFGSMGAPEMLRKTRARSGAPGWEMRRQRMSPRYTTRWDELMVVRA